MTPYKQLNIHSDFFKIHGDCWRTAIGCILDLPPDQVPHFCDYADSEYADPHGRDYIAETRAWLAERGFGLAFGIFEGSPAEVLAAMETLAEGAHWILKGNGPAGPHVVICRGGRVIHDPSPSNGGIVAADASGHCRAYFITRL